MVRASLLAFAAFAIKASAYDVQRLKLKDLVKGESSELQEVLAKRGILLLQLDDRYVQAREKALRGLCDCQLDSTRHFQLDEIKLPDATTRRTVGTATVGHSMLPVPHFVEELCGTETYDAMELLRDIIRESSDVFIQAMDQVIQVSLPTTTGRVYQSVSSIQASANHLEHFHVYDKPIDAPDSMSLHYHTDAGIFLAAAPAMDCATGAVDTSFYLQGETSPLVMQSNELLIMLGTGAQYWLNANLHAARHALQLAPGHRRAWYGKMHLVPQSSIIDGHHTFQDMDLSLQIRDGQPHIKAGTDFQDGCSSSREHRMESLSRRHAMARRVQHVDGPSACNNVTNFFCWYQCLDIPNADQAQGYVNEGYSLYCLDPATLASSGNKVSAAVAPCEGGFTHNSNCLGSWQPTAPDVEPYPVNVSHTAADVDEQFCYGATSMHMEGFQWVGTTCLVYLFPEWVMSSAGKLLGGCVGSILFGFLVELIIWQRRRLNSMKEGKLRLALSGITYGLQLTLGYFVMLVVMTYSGPLFVSVVLGFILGHIIFNAKDALVTSKPTKLHQLARASSGNDACGDLVSNGNFEMETGSSCCLKDSDNSGNVPEGATPCCQYTM